MVLDFMERLVLFHNKLVCCCLLFFFVQCQHKKTESAQVYVWADSVSVTTRLGITQVNGVPFSGILMAYYPGTRDTAYCLAYRKGLEDGTWKKFYPNHQLQELRYFNQGQKIDSCLSWWESGSKRSVSYFVQDEYEGELQEWNAGGQRIKEMHYQAGHEEGSQKAWYDNGKIKSNYVIRAGRRYGLLGTKNCTNVSDSLFKN